MIEINLIPDVKREYLKTRALRNAVMSMSILVGIVIVSVAVVLGLVVAGQLVTQSIQDNTIKSEGAKLTSIEDIDKMVSIQQQLAAIDGQHASKSIDSRMFDVLAAINPPAPNNVIISSLKLDPKEKVISIEGSAANGYVALEVFKKTITNTKVQAKLDAEDIDVPLASGIEAGDNSFGENSEGRRVLRFSFKFTYPDELFAATKSAVSVITPQGRTDVTDSKLGVPSSLFGAKASDIDDEQGAGNGR